jgi:hypothetical protein
MHESKEAQAIPTAEDKSAQPETPKLVPNPTGTGFTDEELKAMTGSVHPRLLAFLGLC